jgi:hypothetical protein
MATGQTADEFFAEVGAGGKSIPHPEGAYQAVVCDIRSLGMIEVQFQGVSKGEKPHILLSWLTTETVPESDEKYGGQPFLVSRRYVLSLHEKARLRKDIEAMLGRKLTADEQKPRGFNIASLLGANCQVTINHSEPKDGKIYGNVVDVSSLLKSIPRITVSETYVRWKDRPENSGAADTEHLQQQVAKIKNLINVAKTYGLEDIVTGDIDNISAGDAEDAIKALEEEIAEAKKQIKAKAESKSEESKEGDFDFDAAYEETVAEEKSEAPKKKAGNINDAVGDVVAKAKSKSDDDEDEDDIFGQSAADAEAARMAENGVPELSDSFRLLIDKADDEMLDTVKFCDNAEALAAINNRLVAMKKKPLNALIDLNTKAAGCALLMKEIAEGRVAW